MTVHILHRAPRAPRVNPLASVVHEQMLTIERLLQVVTEQAAEIEALRAPTPEPAAEAVMAAGWARITGLMHR